MSKYVLTLMIRPSTALRCDRLPRHVPRRLVRFAATENQQIGQRLGASGAAMRAAGEPHGAHEVGHAVHLTTSCRVRRVHRERAGQDHGHAARSGERKRLHDEVVVHRVAVRVELRVIEPCVGERHVADRGVEAAAGKRLSAKLSVRISASG